jgi:hypothetical protein
MELIYVYQYLKNILVLLSVGQHLTNGKSYVENGKNYDWQLEQLMAHQVKYIALRQSHRIIISQGIATTTAYIHK